MLGKQVNTCTRHPEDSRGESSPEQERFTKDTSPPQTWGERNKAGCSQCLPPWGRGSEESASPLKRSHLQTFPSTACTLDSYMAPPEASTGVLSADKEDSRCQCMKS